MWNQSSHLILSKRKRDTTPIGNEVQWPSPTTHLKMKNGAVKSAISTKKAKALTWKPYYLLTMQSTHAHL